jgi:hypothetical protein
MSKRVLLASLLSLSAVGGGLGPASCVQFDGQSVLVRSSPEHDRLDLLLIYRDLHTTGDPAKGLEQLEGIRDGARWFAFYSNFPAMINVDSLATKRRHTDRPAESMWFDALLAHTTVRSGPLWQDSQGRVCGSQLVRLDALSAVVRAMNAVFRESLAVKGKLEDFAADWHIDDAESLRLLREALAADYAFIGLQGSAPRFSLPISNEGFVSFKRAILEGGWKRAEELSRGQAADRAEVQAFIEFLAVNEWTVEHSPGLISFVLGDPRADVVELTMPPAGRAAPGTPDVLARRALVDTLVPRGWTISAADGEAAARSAYDALTREP